MIFGNASRVQDMLPCLPPALRTAIEYLQKTDIATLEPGVYEIQGREIYAQVFDLTTKPIGETRPEVHRQYIDVQFLRTGRERIGVAIETGANKVAEDALAERDVLFYEAAENETILEMVPGNFAVFFPSDVHRPGVAAGAPASVRKAVLKVSVALLG